MKRATIVFLLALVSTLSFGSDAAFVIFNNQVNGPVAAPGEVDIETFRHRQYPGIFWSEGYYHHMNFPDGEVVTVSVGFNLNEASVIFVLGKPGVEPFNDYITADFDDAKFKEQGFDVTIEKSRIWLEGDKYYMDIDFGRVKAKIRYDLLSPSYSYGDCMLRYPDGKNFTCYTLPIPWARASLEATLDGKEYRLEGYGNMNHDAGVLTPIYTPSSWRVFWFFGADHALAVTDLNTHAKFGERLVQRLVFVDSEGNIFTSTDFSHTWQGMVRDDEIPMSYPTVYTISTEAGGAKLEANIRLTDLILKEDLFSNLPYALRLVAERLTRNAWTYDFWCDYDITYTQDGKPRIYKGKGDGRWTGLEEER